MGAARMVGAVRTARGRGGGAAMDAGGADATGTGVGTVEEGFGGASLVVVVDMGASAANAGGFSLLLDDLEEAPP
jgi:hypothetical protein